MYRVDRAMDEIDVVFNLAAMHNDVETVIFTSSDKAINNSNSYGATKLLAEKLVQSVNYSKGRAKTKFVEVRFGNVMGSRGSVFTL